MSIAVNPADRRAHPRFVVSIPGLLILPDSFVEIECQIADMSISGAKVVLRNWQRLPTSVYLLEAQGGQCFECQVRWQNADATGLQFIDICPAWLRRKLQFSAKARHLSGKSNGISAA